MPPTILGLTCTVACALFAGLVAVAVVALMFVAGRRRKSLRRGGSGGTAEPSEGSSPPLPDPNSNEPVPLSGPGDSLGDVY